MSKENLLEKTKETLASWAVPFLTAAITCYVTWGSLNLKMVTNSALVALAPVIIRWLNSKNTMFKKEKI
tara:strand:+ start:310 stop:516 length:207 start_codon:yes stop_codon:yes gene_type:complete